MTAVDDLVANNERHAAAFDGVVHDRLPRRRVAVVACMDGRFDPARALGLEEGDAHIIRNAGGVVSEDVIRSLLVSQRLLGTESIMVILHTDCGMTSFAEGDVKAAIEAETGLRPNFALEAFADLEAEIRQSIRRIRASPFVLSTHDVRGFVYELETGRLREVG